VEVVASLSQGRTAAAQCGLFTYKSVPVIFEPPCNLFFEKEIQVLLSVQAVLITMLCRLIHFFIYRLFYLPPLSPTLQHFSSSFLKSTQLRTS